MKLTRRRLLGGLAVAGASAAGGAGTMAYLTDSEATGVTVNVGNLSLDNTAQFEFSEDPSTEGEDTFEQTITLENDGSLPVRQVVLSDVVFSQGGSLADALKILDLRYGRDSDPENTTSILPDVESDENGNGIFDLDDLRIILNNGEILLEEIVADSETPEGEVLYHGEKSYLYIEAEWDYSKVPEGQDGAAMVGTITIEGRQQENS